MVHGGYHPLKDRPLRIVLGWARNNQKWLHRIEMKREYTEKREKQEIQCRDFPVPIKVNT